MSALITTLALLACSGSVAAGYGGGSNVTIVELNQSKNSTGGEGAVAAGGTLSPFGDIGIGCGVNWQEGVSYGGGLNAGSADFGLGGGYKITPDTMTMGAGIGINGVNGTDGVSGNSTANVQFWGSKNGTFELRFESTSSFTCVPSKNEEEGKYALVCSTS